MSDFDPLAYSAAQAPAATFNPLQYSEYQVTNDALPPDLQAPAQPTAAQTAQGWGEGALSTLTGGVASLGGGLTYLGTLAATGGDTDAAAAVQADTQRALTYAPRTEPGKKVAATISNAAGYLGAKEGEWLGPRAANLATALGAPAKVAGLTGSAAETLANVPQFVVPALKLRAAPEMAPETALTKGLESQSQGAAVVPPDISKASPELRQAIADTGGDINTEALARHLQADSLPIPAKLTKGQALQDAGLISDEKNARGKSDDMRDRLTEQNQNLIDNLDEIRREAAPTAVGNDHIQNGQALLDKYKAYDEPIRADISAKYKALADANGGDLPVDGNSYVSAADAALKQANKARYLPPEIRGTLDDLRDGGNFTFNNFENLRTDLAAAVRKADRAGDGNAKAAINIARDQLEQLPMNTASAPLKALADTARSAAKARFDAIGKDPAYEAAVNDDTPKGEESPIADKFVKNYVLGGSKAGLAQMRDKFANDPEALGTISAAALNYMKGKAGIDPYTNRGNFSQSGFNKARAELEPRMSSLLDPETAQKVRDLGDVAHYQQYEGRGGYTSHSNTFTAWAKHAAEMAGNVIPVPYVGPLGSAIRGLAGKHAEATKIQESLAPGAGIKND